MGHNKHTVCTEMKLQKPLIWQKQKRKNIKPKAYDLREFV